MARRTRGVAVVHVSRARSIAGLAVIFPGRLCVTPTCIHTLLSFPSAPTARSRRMAFDLDACIAQLLQKQLLGEALLREICEKTKELLMRESNVVHISSPVTVVGDIHG